MDMDRTRLFAGLCCLLALACADAARDEPTAPVQAPPPGLEYIPPSPGSYRLPVIQPAADGAVIDIDGSRRRLFDYLGDRFVLLSFVYTRCTDSGGCPLATGVLDMVNEQLESEPVLMSNVRLVTLSFDPGHDAPEVMRRYARHGGRDYSGKRWDSRPWAFLTTPSPEELAPILEGYGQSIVEEVDEEGNATGDYSHVLKVFLIDRQRRVRNIYSTSFLHPATAMNDLKTLSLQEAEPS